MKKIIVDSKKKKEVIDITNKVNELLVENKIDKGTVTLNLLHTTCLLTTADLDPGMDQSILESFEKIIPPVDFSDHHNPQHAYSHVLSSLVGTTLSLIVEAGELVLGTWQRVVLIEFDGPRKREIVIQW